MTIKRSEMKRLVEAWHRGKDATADPRVQQMVQAETARIHRAFDRLPVQVEFVDFDPYDSFEQMRDQVASTGKMLIWTGGSETPLWDEQTNWKARAVHDWDHIQKSCDFSMEGEAALVRYGAQCRPGLAPLYLSEVMLQAAVKNYTGQFAKQKLVLLPEELRRYAMGLRGIEDEEGYLELVWETAGVLRAGSAESAMAHLSARGLDAPTSIVIVDAARMLNTEVDKEAASARDEERIRRSRRMR